MRAEIKTEYMRRLHIHTEGDAAYLDIEALTFSDAVENADESAQETEGIIHTYLTYAQTGELLRAVLEARQAMLPYQKFEEQVKAEDSNDEVLRTKYDWAKYRDGK